MIGWIRYLKHELVRSRGRTHHRYYRYHRRSQSGMALLLAMTIVMMGTVVMSEITVEATVRMQLARNQRDEAKAEALAWSGISFYRLLLTASKGLGKNPMIESLEQMMGVDLSDQLWQFIPFLNSGMLRMLLVADGNPDEGEVEEFKANGLNEEQLAETRKPDGFQKSFLDFDGDFSAEVTDEDKRINITGIHAVNRQALLDDPVALAIYGAMSGIRQCPNPYSLDTTAADEEREDLDRFFLDRNLERWQLIGNLADWTDLDNTRVYDGGSEDALYNNLPREPYLPKNAAFDTLEEVRLVEGWHRDDVWERFGQSLTVFGDGKVNINTAECDVLSGLLKSYIEPPPNPDRLYQLLRSIEEYKAVTTFSSPNTFVQFLQQQDVVVNSRMREAISTESDVFRVTSTGEVNGASVTVEAVFDFTNSKIGRIQSLRIR